MAASSAPAPPRARELAGWKLLARFNTLLEEAAARSPAGSREVHGLRTFERRGYFSLFLLGLFNPVIESMRALCAATRVEEIRESLGLAGAVGLSRFSEAQAVFAPELLQPVLTGLLRQSAGRVKGPAALGGKLSLSAIRIVDSTLWKVVPRMKWAVWRTQGKEQKALRLHVKLRLLDLQVDSAEVTAGRACERAVWLAQARAGEFYIGDRYYGGDYGVLETLEEKGCGFLVRLRHTAVLEVLETREPGAEETAGGVEFDVLARLGHRQGKGPWRVLRFQKPGMSEAVTLAASAECAELTATELMELYHQRWQVEMFFRWLKCLVPCRHWFAESPQGVRLQIYLSLIQALLLAEATGQRPSKRMMELLRFHQMGIATDAELISGLARLAAERDKETARRAAKKSA
ncbi:MAG: IS4 family transposase [Verrucomicrobiota bacterium]